MKPTGNVKVKLKQQNYEPSEGGVQCVSSDLNVTEIAILVVYRWHQSSSTNRSAPRYTLRQFH